MGIDLLSFGHPHSGSSSTPNGLPETPIPELRPPRFGWPELQVEIMKEGIAVAEALPDHPAVIRLCLSTLRTLHPYLNQNSQGHLSKMYPIALGVIRRRGMSVGNVGWWVPGKMVLSMEIATLAANRLPIEHSAAEIAPTGKKDPFLYNPRLKAIEGGRTILVVNEQVDIFVTLQNPFTFDLEVADLSLITTGASFTTVPLPLVLPASSVQTVRVSGLATSPGILQLRGVSIRLTDGASTEVLLPVIDDSAKLSRDKRRSRALGEFGKTKRSGLEARYPALSSDETRDSSAGEEKWLECKVVPEQPLLWVKKTSLTHGTVMLYSGESSTIRITLENSSSVPVDFVKLSFDDSTIREAQAIVSEGELSPEQAYELDWDLVRRPVFTWDQTEMNIPPGGRATLAVQCLGKVGCTDGSIRIDYGYISRSVPSSKAFHTRQISFPVLFTVYHTLDLDDLEIIRLVGSSSSTSSSSLTPNGLLPNGGSNSMLGPYSMSRSSTNPLIPVSPRRGSFAAVHDELQRRMEEESDEAHCLVSVGVRNNYGVPFEVTLTRTGTDLPLDATRLVPPGATERIILPFPRLSLPKSKLDQPIPTLSDRQYVVNKTKKSPLQLQREREVFWYREELLKRITATWVEPGSQRDGTISMRDQILLPDMLEVLRLDEVEVTVSVESKQGRKVKSMDFVQVRVAVTNRLERPFRPFVRLDSNPERLLSIPRRPTTHQTSHHVVFDGTLSSSLPLIAPGESVTHSVGALFLAAGQFAFRAIVEEVPEPASDRVETSSVRFSPILHVHVD